MCSFHITWVKKLSLEQNLFIDEAVHVLALWRPLHGLQVLFIVFAMFVTFSASALGPGLVVHMSMVAKVLILNHYMPSVVNCCKV
jgi:hypothetical protein